MTNSNEYYATLDAATALRRVRTAKANMDSDAYGRELVLRDKKSRDNAKALAVERRIARESAKAQAAINRELREEIKLSELRELMKYLGPMLSEAEGLRRQVAKNSANIIRTTTKLMALIKKDYDL